MKTTIPSSGVRWAKRSRGVLSSGVLSSGTWAGCPPTQGLGFPGRGKAVMVTSFLSPCHGESIQQAPNKDRVPGLLHKDLAIRDLPTLRSRLCTPCRPHSRDHWVPGEPHDAQASGRFCLKAAQGLGDLSGSCNRCWGAGLCPGSRPECPSQGAGVGSLKREVSISPQPSPASYVVSSSLASNTPNRPVREILGSGQIGRAHV